MTRGSIASSGRGRGPTLMCKGQPMLPQETLVFPPILKIPQPRKNYVFVLYAEAISERGTGPRKGACRIRVNNGSSLAEPSPSSRRGLTCRRS